MIQKIAGQKRVIITQVKPHIECGRFSAKGAVNTQTLITASVFTDGHDEIKTSVLLRHKSENQWTEFPMQFINNDHWEYPFYPEKTGIYSFQIIGWIDHFTTWKKGVYKKKYAGQEISLELKIGQGILQDALNRAIRRDKTTLQKTLESIIAEAGNEEVVLNIFMNEDVAAAINRSRDKKLVTVSAETYNIEVETKRAVFSSWYELFPRSASPHADKHGTFKDVIALLPKVEEMGFDTLYMPPIHPIGEEKRKGKNNSLVATENDPGSPWAIGSKLGGHKAIHPELGSLKYFKELVQAARKKNIEVALDIAFQCAPDHPYVKEHPEWFTWRPDGTVQYAENPPKKYEDILPFNFETDDWQALWEELKSIIIYWIEQGVRVFRIDNPHTKAFAFWEWMIGEVRAQYPEVIFLAEAFTRPRIMERLAKAGFNQSYTYFTWRNTKADLEEYLTELTTTDLRYYFRPNFWPNTPDILPPELTTGGENAHVLRVILAATLSSNYGLYGPVYEHAFTEPMPGKEEYIDNEKYQLRNWNWNEKTRVRDVITQLNKIRKAHTALQDTNNVRFTKTSSEQIIGYFKHDKRNNDLLLIAVNLDPNNVQSGMVHVPVEDFGLRTDAFTVKDLLSGAEYFWQPGWNYVELRNDAMPAHIFQISQNTFTQ